MYFHIVLVLCVLVGFAWIQDARAQDRYDPHAWEVHDTNRPLPPIVDPGTCGTQAPARPPSDATVLFDGSDLSQWASSRDGDAPWRVEGGYFEVIPRSGGIQTRRGFGDVQVHVEWSAPSEVTGDGQNRGNSGVFLMGRYEVQVLDSYDNVTYADGQAASLYGQYPPLVNAMCPPGQWNTYDIVFFRPRFSDAGELLQPAYVTVFHNGVLVQDHVELTGPTSHQSRPAYSAHPDRLPISLQDHGDPVRFRNIWVRELE